MFEFERIHFSFKISGKCKDNGAIDKDLAI
jgi:hypothetical protein